MTQPQQPEPTPTPTPQITYPQMGAVWSVDRDEVHRVVRVVECGRRRV